MRNGAEYIENLSHSRSFLVNDPGIYPGDIGLDSISLLTTNN
jgi:hypothetical protein